MSRFYFRSSCSTLDPYDSDHAMKRSRVCKKKVKNTVNVEVEVSNSRTWLFMSVI